ncbi:MAG: hypothetical protein ACK5TG_15280 [Planctomyces sp.]|jgi:hypothetical protein|nr:hypothetical protein [Planctomyces sp.]
MPGRSQHGPHFLCLALLLLATTGCSLVESPKSASRRFTRMFTPNGRDWSDPAQEDNGEWDFVGDEGRAEFAREQDPDPWYGKHLMSDKARSIERNLGIDY